MKNFECEIKEVMSDIFDLRWAARPKGQPNRTTTCMCPDADDARHGKVSSVSSDGGGRRQAFELSGAAQHELYTAQTSQCPNAGISSEMVEKSSEVVKTLVSARPQIALLKQTT